MPHRGTLDRSLTRPGDIVSLSAMRIRDLHLVLYVFSGCFYEHDLLKLFMYIYWINS